MAGEFNSFSAQVQDIPSEVYNAKTPEEVINAGKENMHRNYWQKISDDQLLAGINFHTIRFTDHPLFGNKIKISKNSAPLVYSSHHQTVEKLGKDLEITALSSDGKIIEGLAHRLYENVFSVQFHPEVPALYEEREKYKITPDDTPETYFNILGRKNQRFHKKYWRHLSKSIKKAHR